MSLINLTPSLMEVLKRLSVIETGLKDEKIPENAENWPVDTNVFVYLLLNLQQLTEEMAQKEIDIVNLGPDINPSDGETLTAGSLLSIILNLFTLAKPNKLESTLSPMTVEHISDLLGRFIGGNERMKDEFDNFIINNRILEDQDYIFPDNLSTIFKKHLINAHRIKGYSFRTNPKFAVTMFKNMCQIFLDFELIHNGLSQPFPIHDIKQNTKQLNKLSHEHMEIAKAVMFNYTKENAYKKINKDWKRTKEQETRAKEDLIKQAQIKNEINQSILDGLNIKKNAIEKGLIPKNFDINDLFLSLNEKKLINTPPSSLSRDQNLDIEDTQLFFTFYKDFCISTLHNLNHLKNLFSTVQTSFSSFIIKGTYDSVEFDGITSNKEKIIKTSDKNKKTTKLNSKNDEDNLSMHLKKTSKLLISQIDLMIDYVIARLSLEEGLLKSENGEIAAINIQKLALLSFTSYKSIKNEFWKEDSILTKNKHLLNELNLEDTDYVHIEDAYEWLTDAKRKFEFSPLIDCSHVISSYIDLNFFNELEQKKL